MHILCKHSRIEDERQNNECQHVLGILKFSISKRDSCLFKNLDSDPGSSPEQASPDDEYAQYRDY